jgi:hypothetical protein
MSGFPLLPLDIPLKEQCSQSCVHRPPYQRYFWYEQAWDGEYVRQWSVSGILCVECSWKLQARKEKKG